MSEPRCPTCGALVTADAEWCNQCFTRLRPGERERPAPAAAGERAAAGSSASEGTGEPRPTAPPGGAGTLSADAKLRAAEGGRVVWDCPACGQENDLALRACPRCGTAFARLFEEPEPPPRVTAQRAAAFSLLLPGLGHVLAGKVADGVARTVVFAFTFGMVVAMVTAGGALGGPLLPLVALFVGATLTLYAGTAVDAYRAVTKEAPVISTRMLLIGATGLLLVAMGVLVIGGVSAR